MRQTFYIGGSQDEAFTAATRATRTSRHDHIPISRVEQFVGKPTDCLVELVGSFWQRPMREIDSFLDAIQRFDNRGLPEGVNSDARQPRLHFY